MSRKASLTDQVYEKLKATGFKCALTGWPITPNEFELDHIVSVQDGGKDEIDNLACVHPLVNRAKGTMGVQQFVEMCTAVADHARATANNGDSNGE